MLSCSSHLHAIHFRNGPLDGSSAAGLTPTARAVYDQYRDLLRLLDTGAVPLDVAKVFVCGDYGIGKTTLIKTLETSRHRASLFQPRDRPDTPSERTQGVQMKQLRLQHQPRAGRTATVGLKDVTSSVSRVPPVLASESRAPHVTCR